MIFNSGEIVLLFDEPHKVVFQGRYSITLENVYTKEVVVGGKENKNIKKLSTKEREKYEH